MTTERFIKDPEHYHIGIAVAEMKKDIDYLKSGQDETKSDIKTILNKLDGLEEKFASKWVEKVSIGIIITVIGAISTLIFKLT